MENERLQLLLKKYIEESCTAAETAELDEWFHTLNYRHINFDEWMAQSGGADAVAGNLFEDFKTRYMEKPEVKRLRLLYKTVAAVAAAVAIIAGIYFFKSSDHSGPSYANDIAPGKNTATLTLANGKTISLSDSKDGVVIDAAQIKYNDGSKVQVSSGTQSLGPQKGGQSITGPVGDPSLYSKNSVLNSKDQLIASTPRGGTYQVTLPDGTKVWLNAASSLRFPSTFANVKDRRVQLNGEAYFEVTKTYVSLPGANPSLPGHRTKQTFIVVTNNQEVEVLGTHFNINSYADEASTKTTLLEGSVKITSLQGSAVPSLPGGTVKQPHSTIILKPNQQSILSGNTIDVKTVEVEDAVDWKNGSFLFKNESLAQIMRRVARWYNIEVIYQNGVDQSETFSGKVSRNRNVSEVLENMEATGKLKFKIEGKRVTVIDN